MWSHVGVRVCVHVHRYMWILIYEFDRYWYHIHCVLSNKCWKANLVPGTLVRPTCWWGDRWRTTSSFNRSSRGTVLGARHCSRRQGYSRIHKSLIVKRDILWKCWLLESEASTAAGWLQRTPPGGSNTWAETEWTEWVSSSLLGMCLNMRDLILFWIYSYGFKLDACFRQARLMSKWDHTKTMLNGRSSFYTRQKKLLKEVLPKAL